MNFWNKISNWFRSLFWTRELELSIVGLMNAGKTTFVNTIATNQFDEETMPTIGFNRKHIRKGKVELRLWDLSGHAKFRESWEKYCRGVDCIVFIVDSADHANLEVASAQLHKLVSWPSLQNIPLLVLGNKNDLDGSLNEEELISALGLQSISDRSVACYSVSSKNQNNIDVVLSYLTNLPKKG